jgi:hypothetical protein
MGYGRMGSGVLVVFILRVIPICREKEHTFENQSSIIPLFHDSICLARATNLEI